MTLICHQQFSDNNLSRRHQFVLNDTNLSPMTFNESLFSDRYNRFLQLTSQHFTRSGRLRNCSVTKTTHYV